MSLSSTLARNEKVEHCWESRTLYKDKNP